MAIVAPFLPYDKLREVADRFLKTHHSSGEIPIPIEEIVEFQLGLDIVPIPGLQRDFDIEAFISSDLTEICVDQFIQRERQGRYRFSLAHEIAHILVHQDVFKELRRFSTIAEWKEVITTIPEEPYSWIEWQAYALAGLILVPSIPLRAIFDDSVKKAASAGVTLKHIDRDARKVVESHIAQHFDVSREVITKRMKADKLWP
jgi:hypothetical protein